MPAAILPAEIVLEASQSIADIAHVIQIAVAPVFLLTGIAGILNVLSARLGRITDRARLLEQRIPQVQEAERRQWLKLHADLLWRRIRMINWSIRLSVGGALMICLVVMALFVEDWVPNIAALIAAMFVAAMVLVVGSLLLLLIEVSLSTRRTRQELEAFLATSSSSPDS